MPSPEKVTKESFRAELEQLVANFAANEDELTSPGYTETQARTQFITPFFRALGWDIENRAARPRREMDVWEETGPGEGRPDYTFRLGALSKFIVEAKAPHEDLDTERHVLQAKSYAWSTSEVFAVVLTDFEEFRFYDASLEPDPNDAHRGLLLDLRYKQYLAHLDKLWDFSCERVAAGSLEALLPQDRLSVRHRRKVDDRFLEDMSRWREEFAKAVHKRNPELSAPALTDIVQRLLDRLIFIRVAEDRRILEKNSLLDCALDWEAVGGRKPLLPRLNDLFHQINEDFNGEIFKFHPCEGIALDDPVLHRIIKELYPPKSPYRFDVIPVDIFGAVYERYLGKTIYVKGKTVKVDDKPEVRKAGGVYYTPKYIVDYIVNHTVGKLIEGKSPKEIEKICILDPACGSGSFLLGAFQCLIDHHVAWYEKHPKDARIHPLYPDVINLHPEFSPAAPAAGTKSSPSTPSPVASPESGRGAPATGGEPRLSIHRKARILRNNLYGVDLDPQAVEITMMNLYLKALEGERDLPHKQHLLPELAGNLRCGNSLIATDIREQQPNLSEEEFQRLRPFDWHSKTDGFGDIMEKGGFDAVIGNPPYGADYTPIEKGYFHSRYVYRKGKPETYIYFLEKGMRLLRHGGMLGFITPTAWLTNYYGVQLRREILQHCLLEDIVDLEPTRVFQEAVVDTVITVLSKETSSKRTHKTRVSQGTKDHEIIPRFETQQANWESDPELIINVQATPSDSKLLRKVEGSGQTLNEFVDYSQGVIPYKTKEQGRANRYISPKRKGKGWLPLIENASQVRRYELDRPKAFISYGDWLWCPREPRYFSQSKILFHRLRKKLPRQLVGALDESGAINRHSLSNLVLRPGLQPNTLRFVLGLFNSKLANWWFVKRYGLLMEVAGFKVGKLPLPRKWANRQDEVATLVDRLLKLNKKNQSSQISPTALHRLQREITETNERIDELIYDLYGLTDADRKLVVESLPD